MPPSEDEDLDYWLATQTLPRDGADGGGSGGGGVWQRAAQLLAAQRQAPPPDPMPTRGGNGMSWSTALAALLSKDPGGVVTADAANRRADLDAWQKRQYAREGQGFERQMQLAGLLERAGNTEWQHGHTEARDQVGDQHWSAEEQRARDQMAQQALQARQQLGLGYSRLKQDQTQFDASQSGLDRRQQAQLAAQIGMNDADNAAALAAAQAKAAGAVRAPIPGTHITDPDAYQQFMQSPANVKDLSEHVGTAQQVQGYVKQLRKLLEDKPSAAGAATYNTIIKQLIGDRSKEGSTGVLSNTEFARYIEDLPEYGALGKFKNWRSTLQALTPGAPDPRISTLDALDGALRKGQSSKFGAYGIALDDGGAPAPTVPGPAAPPPPTAAAPDDDPLLKRYGRLRAVP